MGLQTNLQGRIKNVPLAGHDTFNAVYEAISNSIHACEEVPTRDIQNGNIFLDLQRDGISPFFGSQNPSVISQSNNKDDSKITGFTIIDDGIGFTDSNFESFNILDTDRKADIGGRGVGRLLWLKVFKDVNIHSTFSENGKKFVRTFSFTKDNGIVPPDSNLKEVNKSPTLETIISLSDIIDVYAPFAQLSVKEIACGTLEHFLWYFIRDEGVPSITIRDGLTQISLNDLFNEYIINNFQKDEISVCGHKFNLAFAKARNDKSSYHSIFYCAANRPVKIENITNKIPGLFKKIQDEHGTFKLLCFASGKYLDDSVRPERTGFSFLENPISPTSTETQPSYSAITKEILNNISNRFSDLFSKNREIGRERIVNFVNDGVPKYKPIIQKYPDLLVDPDSKDKDVELLLHKAKATLEAEIISESEKLTMPDDGEPFEEYEKRMHECLSKVNVVSMAELAGYVSHRKIVLDFLSTCMGKVRAGKYEQEKVIHQLIMPMRTDSKQEEFSKTNLWLLDDRLAFFEYLASDLPLSSNPHLDSSDLSRPDILGLKIFDTPHLVNDTNTYSLASITVVEIKRPMQKDMNDDRNPIAQTLEYVEKIRNGKIMSPDGRYIDSILEAPAFCYILSDLTDAMKKHARHFGLNQTYDRNGFFGYNPNYKAYINVISFNGLIKSAIERNKAFFDKLNLKY
jgi:hypothetical protein